MSLCPVQTPEWDLSLSLSLPMGLEDLVPFRHHQYFSKFRLPQLLCSLNPGTGTKPHNICEHSQLINPAEILDIEYSLGNCSQSIHKCKQHNLPPPKPPTSYEVIHSINITKKYNLENLRNSNLKHSTNKIYTQTQIIRLV